MAKPTTVKVRLNSEANTGFFYVTRKNTRTMTEKMSALQRSGERILTDFKASPQRAT